MAAKTGPKYKMSSHHRDKIKNSNILNALIEHVDGKREMRASQVTAALGLLDRIMPKLATTTLEGSGTNGEFIHSITLTGVKADES